MRLTAGCLGLLTAGGGLSGCFYVDQINHAPSASIEVSGEVVAGGVLRLSASASRDADDDALEYAWMIRCLDDSCPEVTALGAQLDLTLTSKAARDVVLVVTDVHGATGQATRRVTPVNRAPSVSLGLFDGTPTPGGCYTVGRRLGFAAQAVDPDGDPLELTWQLSVPPASDPDVREDGPGEADATYVVRPDVAGGGWRLRVIATDPDGATAEADRPFCVDADGPPCLTAVEPALPPGALAILATSAGPRRFAALTVQDDLDPYPAPIGASDPVLGEARFVWSLGAADAPPSVLPDGLGAEITLDPDAYPAGTRLRLRLDVRDRVTRASCPVAQDTCELAPGCAQRHTFHLEVR